MAQLALNGRPNSAIGGISPFFLWNRCEIDPLTESTVTDEGTIRHPGKTSAERYVQRLKDAQDFAQAAMTSAQQRY